ncbi:MAG: GTP 3',8-cyclase MoaA [Deltaproteobacteria bacterium]|nr:GTP 3',8-cyclase MoaA [Deltaproteobacteria bacterium]
MALFDLHKRRINYLRISVTDRCNLRCLYCVPDRERSFLSREEILRYEEILRVASFAVREGITKIRITGGEPLIRRGVVDLIARLHRIPGLVEISLTTNGIRLKDLARPLYLAGVRRINISLDTLNPKRFRRITRQGAIDEVFAGIAAAEAEGFFPIKLNMVVMKGVNDHEIPEFVRLARESPYHIRFVELMPMGLCPVPRHSFLPATEILDAVRSHADISPVPPHPYEGPAVRYRIQGGKGEIGIISPLSNHFCGSCNRLRLTADGHLRSCLFSDREIHLKPALRNGRDNAAIEKQLKILFQQALHAKPAGHMIRSDDSAGLARTMTAIGG